MYVPLGLGRGSLVKITDLSSIKATRAATKYFTEQARENPGFDAREKENDEFWEAVSNFTSYRDKYTGDSDQVTTIWKDKVRENPELYERDCEHCYDCKKINNCTCTIQQRKKGLPQT